MTDIILLSDDETEIDPFSDDKKYQKYLWFQDEALMSSVTVISDNEEENLITGTSSNKRLKEEEVVVVDDDAKESVLEHPKKKKKVLKEEVVVVVDDDDDDNNGKESEGESSEKNKLKKKVDYSIELGKNSIRFCGICMDRKRRDEMFNNTNKCSHNFCSDCISKHITAKIQENNIWVTCPEPDCKETLEPHMCQTIIPKEVFDRWGNAICESSILGSQKFYCPFKDCSAMLVNDGEEVIMEANCPHCQRLFCAQCNVPWHKDIECKDFQELNRDENEREGIMLMKLAKKRNWRRCPNCKMFVARNGGCQHMICRCKTEFCYKCGLEWRNSCRGLCGSKPPTHTRELNPLIAGRRELNPVWNEIPTSNLSPAQLVNNPNPWTPQLNHLNASSGVTSWGASQPQFIRHNQSMV